MSGMRPYKFSIFIHRIITAKCQGRTGWKPGFQVWKSEGWRDFEGAKELLEWAKVPWYQFVTVSFQYQSLPISTWVVHKVKKEYTPHIVQTPHHRGRKGVAASVQCELCVGHAVSIYDLKKWRHSLRTR